MILLLVLAVLVSLLDYRPDEMAYGGGSGMRFKGDSGVIVPGGGELVAEVSYTPMQAEKKENEPPEKTESNQATNQATSDKTSEETKATSEEATEETTEEHKGEHKKVNALMVTFWHAVAAVLVGVMLTLLVEFVWTKIRGGK